MLDENVNNPGEASIEPCTTPGEVTKVLQRIRSGDSSAAVHLWELVYGELKKIASFHLRQDRASEILQTTAVVHEAYLRLVHRSRVGWEDRAHFYRTAARAIRRILVDWSRSAQAGKRGGGRKRVVLEDSMRICGPRDIDLLDLDDVLERFQKVDRRACEACELRVFSGLSTQEVARIQGVSRRTVVADWEYARTWLSRALQPEDPETSQSPGWHPDVSDNFNHP